MPEYVPHDRIEMKVVKEWARLVRETAQERGHNLSIVQPFHPYEQTFSDVLAEVKAGTHRGLEFYRMMVQQIPWYDFQKCTTFS